MAKLTNRPNQYTKFIVAFLAVMLLFLLLNTLVKPGAEPAELKYHEFVEAVQLPASSTNKVVEVTIQENNITGKRADQTTFKSYVQYDAEIRKMLQENSVAINFKPPEEAGIWKTLLIQSLPVLLILFIFFLFMRQLQVGGGKAMSFGKSRAKLMPEGKTKVTFKDIAGIEESKQELVEIIDFLRDPKRFSKLGARIPKGVLLVGSPGTGKTLLAKAIAGEAGVPFFSISGSDFVEMFVGVGASRVRDLFEQAKKNAPCIVFIDEIDAVGRHRGAGLGGGHDEREQTLNQLLVEMDGFEENEGVIIIAATNRVDVLDPALLRPGRFDRRVVVPKPDIRGRIGILRVHTRKTPLDKDVDLNKIARGTPGLSGADLQNLVNEAALIAARRQDEFIHMNHFELAKDKILMGPERRSMLMSEEEKRNTAIHEAGHALVGMNVKGADPVHKITIIPRGHALGVTVMLPEEDRLTISREYAEGMIAYAMGGRAAEELVYNRRTTGAGDDIKKATEIARQMVCNWGMSDAIGPLSLDKNSQEVFLGREIGQSLHHSEKLLEVIDSEIRRFTEEGYKRAFKILTEHRQALERIADALLVKETINHDELVKLAAGESVLTDEDHEAHADRLAKQKETIKNLQKVARVGDEEKDSSEDKHARHFNTVPQGT
ncbi:MAG: ATP-dependent zinc metalloprotease FtsH [Oligoflexales bacterium]|nr:ATP-dependent zinc metalloprotease FtsH [Oligoflexales bacterium]